MKLSLIRRLVAVVPVLVCATAMASPWTVPSGSLSSDINYSNGHNDTDKFGDPTIVSSAFHFAPSDFNASSPVFFIPAEAHDSASVTLSFLNGKQIHSVHADFAGDYDTTALLSSAGYSATLTATNLSTMEVAMKTISPQLFSDSASDFNDSLTLNLPSGWSGDVLLQLNATLNAQGSFIIGGPLSPMNLDDPQVPDFGFGSIELTSANLGASMAGANAVVPLPAAIATFPLLAGVAGIASRKFRRSKI